MRTVIRLWMIVGGSVMLASPAAAAQDPAWVRDLEAHIEQFEKAVRVAAPHLEAAADAMARAIERQDRPARPQNPQNPQNPQGRQRGRRGPEFTEPFSRTLRLGRTGTFELSNVAGNVTVTGGEGEDVRIEATKRVYGVSEPTAREILREFSIQVNDRNGFVEVRTEYPQRRNFSGEIEYTITLPTGANVAIKSVSGDIRVANVKGELRAESVSGNVHTTAAGRLRSVRSVSGDVSIVDAAAEDLNGGTVSGNLNIRNLKARAVDVESVSGDIVLIDTECERVNLKSISGDLEYTGSLVRNGRYELQSHSGDIRITPSANPGFDVDASTFSGDVRSDFGLTMRGTGNGLVRRGPGQSFRGSFGDASAILSLRSFSGDITIAKR